MTDSSLFPQVQRPGRYLGKEFNTIIKEWEKASVRCCLVFPDLYEIGMSHQGLQILYHLLNQESNFLAERCYCPDKDVEALMRQNDIPLSSLESGKSLAEFDLVGITLPYELCYTNILTALDLARIPVWSKDRDSSHPIILGGGACAMNPEPVADFFDAVLLGDGEEAILELGTRIAQANRENWDRTTLLSSLEEIEGVYIPAHFTPHYEDGKIAGIERLGSGPRTIYRRVVSDLEKQDHLLHPIVPNAKIVHDRLGLEIARGCTRGCRFCQAGMTYRPVRERSPEQLLEMAKKGIANSGFEELALLSLSTGDYSCLSEILPQLMDVFADEYVSVAMPSMRVGTLTPEIMDQIKRVRKTGFTLAPEAGSERLRRVINKGITEEDLLHTCRTAFTLGWKLIKLYFMIGLPTETDEDLQAIIDLVKKTAREISQVATGKRQINVSVGTFVPKPHTPFQWDRQLSLEESRQRITFLKKNLPRKNCNLKYHNPEMSFLEGVFSRGDRKLGALIYAAWSLGARLDGWSDYFDLDLWSEASKQCDIDLNHYLRERSTDEILPWHHLDTGIDQEYLLGERENGFQEIYTPDCRYHGCQQCGLCDFETLQPIVHSEHEPGTAEPSQAVAAPTPRLDKRAIPAHEENHFKYMVHYSRQGNICYLGHLEILQLFFRALRRANIEVNFSKGFNPSPKISFGPALPVGTQSEAEYFLMDLPQVLTNTETAIRNFNTNLPPGITVTDIEAHSGKLPQSILSSYSLTFKRSVTEDEIRLIEEFLVKDSFHISRVRKGKKREYDIRALIPQLRLEKSDTLFMQIINTSGAPSIKPSDSLVHILGMDENEALGVSITKIAWSENHTT